MDALPPPVIDVGPRSPSPKPTPPGTRQPATSPAARGADQHVSGPMRLPRSTPSRAFPGDSACAPRHTPERRFAPRNRRSVMACTVARCQESTETASTISRNTVQHQPKANCHRSGEVAQTLRAGEGIRTPNLPITSRMRCQLRHAGGCPLMLVGRCSGGQNRQHSDGSPREMLPGAAAEPHPPRAACWALDSCWLGSCTRS
jgi:hypothetical protein